MEKMYKQYGEQVQFFVVYVREAHPNELISQPTDYIGRVENAHEMCTNMKLSLPTLIDGIDNRVGNDYAGMPDRLYLVSSDGTVVFQGARGPFGFHPEELEAAITKELKK